MLRLVSLTPVARTSSLILRPLSSTTSNVSMFANTSTAFASKSTAELLRGIFVFKMCSLKVFVDRADTLVSLSNRFLGSSVTEAITKASFFGHFCGGETEQSLSPVIDRLWEFRVGAILDYAAEADLKESDTIVQTHSVGTVVDEDGDSDVGHSSSSSSPYRLRRTRSGIHARTYDYVDDANCDANVAIFEDCVRAVRNVSPHGFAAIKITALGNPLLLERVATMMTESKRLFERMDESGTGRLSRDDFHRACTAFFNYEKAEVDAIFDDVCSRRSRAQDEAGKDFIDVVEWMSTIEPSRVSQLVKRCKDHGPLSKAALTPDELGRMDALYRRVDRIAALAQSLDVRLMVDAEQSYFQPAIDALVLRLQRHHNLERPMVFNTYQCYLVDAEQRAVQDMERARREGWKFAAKLVRGAYLVTERARAKEHGYASPVHDTLDDTHKCYNSVLTLMLRESQSHGANLMVATHNQESCMVAVEHMRASADSDLPNRVFFGQLLGMADYVTFILGHHGYKAFKCECAQASELLLAPQSRDSLSICNLVTLDACLQMYPMVPATR